MLRLPTVQCIACGHPVMIQPKWSIPNICEALHFFCEKMSRLVKSSVTNSMIPGLQIPWQVHPIGQGTTSFHFAFHPLSLSDRCGRVRDEGIAGKLIWVQLIIGLSILIAKTHTKMMPLKTAKKTPLDRNWIPFKANSCKISTLKTNHLPPLKMINIQQQKPPAPNPRRGAGKVTVPRPCSRPWRQLPTSKDCLEGMILCRCVFHAWYIYI